MTLAYKQGRLTKTVEHNICNSITNTEQVRKNTDEIINLRIEIVKLTNQLKLDKFK